MTAERQSFRSRYVIEATRRLIISVGEPPPRCSVREQRSRESVKAWLRHRVTWRIIKNGKRKEKRWSGFSDAVTFMVGIGAAKKQARRERDRCSAREPQRVDDQCDVRWWASRSGGQSINH